MARFLWVGLGGAIGAIFRYVISLIPWKDGFFGADAGDESGRGRSYRSCRGSGGKARGWPLSRLVS